PAVVGLDELEVVDDDEPEALAELQAAGVGGDAEHPLSGRVVDEQPGPREGPAGVDQSLHVLAVEVALAQLVTVDAGLAAQQTLRQLDPRLLQADEEDGGLLLKDDITDKVERECRFSD